MSYQCVDTYQKIFVSSIEEIYDIIQKYKAFHNLPRKVTDGEPLLDVFYRGQSDREWDIIPSLLRWNINEAEHIQTYAPKEPLSLFETVADIQHYHQKTRFIDFTMNPNVAIYFACSEHQDKDGAFYIYSYAPHKPEWHTTVILTELVRIQNEDEMSVEEFSQEILKHHPELSVQFSSEKELHGTIMSFLDHGFMVLPDSENYGNNLRLQRQAGCFFVCGVKIPQLKISEKSLKEKAKEELEEASKEISRAYWFSRAGKNRFKPHSVIIPDSLKIPCSDNLGKNCTAASEEGRGLVKVIIPHKIKDEFLWQLSLKGITEEYLLPPRHLMV